MTKQEIETAHRNLQAKVAKLGRPLNEIEIELAQLREVVRRYQEAIQQAQGLAGLDLTVYPKFKELRHDLQINRYAYVASQIA